MKWTLVKCQNSAYREYYFNEPTRQLVVKFNPEQHAIRLLSGHQQTVFYLEAVPNNSGKKLLTNQYGMEVGNILFRYADCSEGTLTVHDERYYFRFLQQDDQMLLAITDYSSNYSLLQCSINEAAYSGLSSHERCSWLAGLCWCIQVYELMPVRL
jgi:hypothetical protein